MVCSISNSPLKEGWVLLGPVPQREQRGSRQGLGDCRRVPTDTDCSEISLITSGLVPACQEVEAALSVIWRLYGTIRAETTATEAGMVALFVDSRETSSGIPARLRSAGVPIEQQEMAAGDYRIGEILIERKSANDLAVSIMDGRLFGQAEAINVAADRSMLLVEGHVSTARSQISEDALWGAISALAVYWHMQVIFSTDEAATAKLLERMWRHTTEGLGYEIPLRTGKPQVKPDGACSQYLVEGLPGVGPETARRLVSHFGSARAVFAASPLELRSCKGVGPKTADAIAGALDLRPSSYRRTKLPPPVV